MTIDIAVGDHVFISPLHPIVRSTVFATDARPLDIRLPKGLFLVTGRLSVAVQLLQDYQFYAVRYDDLTRALRGQYDKKIRRWT